MEILELIKLSLKSLYGFKMRSFLTTLGIIVGIGSVVMISSIGAGFESGLLSDVSKISAKLITVSINHQKLGKSERSRNHYFTESDMLLMEKQENIDKVFVENGLLGIDGEGRYYRVAAYGKKALDVLSPKISTGRSFTEDEFNSKNNLAVLGRTSAINLFGSEKEALGKQLTFDTFNYDTRETLTIIGTYIEPHEKIKKTFNDKTIDVITNDKDFSNVEFHETVTVKVKNEKDISKTVNQIKEYLNAKSDYQDIYDVKLYSEDVNKLSDVLNKISLFISLVASISLAVGGIGVMNIMLVSVTERISEIGLRKAIGAKNKDILMQFLIESVTLTLLGGLIGVLFGLTLAFLVGIPFGIVPILKLNILIVALVVSMGTGLIFGIYPAKKASKLSPMEALRSE
ncbi:ABC transporter permease [Streptobacillus ratti]|uniref:ABC transporter permease n=1 Tax=Streptobacillus ratti TaxID=1720557 RepID=UPI00093503A9|nr:ABC transporter permease [Streptobacillus ratti]